MMHNGEFQMEEHKTPQQRRTRGYYYLLYALGCLAYLNSICWILMDMMFNMADKGMYVLLGIILGVLFLRMANLFYDDVGKTEP